MGKGEIEGWDGRKQLLYDKFRKKKRGISPPNLISGQQDAFRRPSLLQI